MNTIRTTSSYTILSKINRDFKPDNSDWVNDAIEWIGEGILFIKSFTGLEKGIITKTVEDYRCSIPCEIESIEWIEYKGEWLPLGTSKASYGISKEKPSTANVKASTNFFVFNFNYINTSFEKGEIKLHCTYLPVDDKGLPMFIDHVKHKEFLSWYVYSKMLLSGYKHHDPNINYIYADHKAMKELLPKAKNAIKYPNDMKMHRLKSLFTKMSVDFQASDNLFMNSENMEYRDL